MDVSRIPVQAVIERKFQLKESGTRYLRGVEHDSLVVDLQKNIFHWNSIDLHGNAVTWLMKVEGLSYRQSLEELENYTGIPFTRKFQKLEEPTPIYSRLLDAFYKLGKKHKSYWEKRGYTEETIDKYKLGYSGDGVYVIPLFKDGELHNFQCRHSKKKRIWSWASGRGPVLFGEDKVDSSYVFLAEGPTDAIILNQMGMPAISHNGGSGAWIDEWNKYILNFSYIYMIYDNDDAGIKSSVRVSKKLLNRAYVLFWPKHFREGFDVNEAYLTFGAKRVKMLIQDAMLENAVHSSEVNKQDRHYGLSNSEVEFINSIRAKVSNKAREIL